MKNCQQISIFMKEEKEKDGQIKLVIPEENKELHQIYKKIPKKRIHYKSAGYHKVYKNYTDTNGNIFDDTHTYGRLDAVYLQLANAFLFFRGTDDYIENGIIRSWKTEYFREKYIYNGKEHKGEEFTVRRAEIKGTEDLIPEVRLFIHEALLEALEEGYKIEQCNMWLEELINYFKQGYRLCDVILALILYRGGHNG